MANNDFVIQDNVLLECNATDSHVFIPEAVHTIRKAAFSHCTNLTSITIPEYLTTIEQDSFSCCYRLTCITVSAFNPEYTAEDGILYNKKKRKIVCVPKAIEGDIILPDTLWYIGVRAFAGCVNLRSVDTGDGAKKIQYQAFSGCSNLRNVTLGKKISRIEDLAFMGCNNLNSIIIPDLVTRFGVLIFEDLIEITNKITMFGHYDSYVENYAEENNFPFAYIDDNNVLLEVASYYTDYDFEIPEGIVEIGPKAFSYCKELHNIIIPASVEKIAEDAFEDCYNLKRIIVNNNNPNYSSKGGTLYNKEITKILWVPQENPGPLEVPDRVPIIRSDMFKQCIKLETIDVAYTMSLIDWEEADTNHTPISFVSFNVERINPNYTSFEGVLYDKHMKKIIHVPRSLKGHFQLPSSLGAVNENDFAHCHLLTSIDTGDDITTINPRAFLDCKRLRHIRIGKNVNYIDEQAFAECYNLRDFTIDEENEIFYVLNNVLYDITDDRCICNAIGMRRERDAKLKAESENEELPTNS